jgi:hypothetical protein
LSHDFDKLTNQSTRDSVTRDTGSALGAPEQIAEVGASMIEQLTRMGQRRFDPTTLTGFTLLLMTAVTAQTATTAPRPAPPPQVCLGNVCSPVAKKPSTSAPGTGIKWHPGHYGLSMTKSISANTASQVHADWAAMLNSDSHFVGVFAFYDWYHLEPTAQGAYDFSTIDNDIAWLNANFPGKKLLIEVWSRNFCQVTALPTVPQDTNARCTKVPDYVISGAFTGSSGNPGATWNKNGLLAAFWSSAVLARLQALDAALAARYDNNPTVEAIRYDEYTPPGPLPGAPALGFSQGAEVSAWNALHATMAADWVHTNKANHANFPANASGRVDKGLFSYLQSIKVGVGGPDILPPISQGGCCGGESFGAQILRGAGVVNGSDFGTTDYRGTIPIIYEAENPAWPMDAAELESYAYNTLQATHVGWLYNPSNVGGGSWTPGSGSTPWTTASSNANGSAGVLDTLQANRFRIHAGCPTIYNGTCNTN